MAERHKHIRSFSSSSRCYRFLYLLLIGWIAGPLSAAAQDSLQPIQRIDSLAKLRVNSIELIGNNKTKSYININSAQQLLQEGSSYITDINVNVIDPEKAEEIALKIKNLTR